MNRFLLSLVILSVSLPIFAGDFEIIKDRVLEDYKVKGTSQEIKSWKVTAIESWMREQRSNGSWADVNYESQNDATFQVIQHLVRIEIFSQAWASPNHKYHKSKKLEEYIWRAYDFWITKNPQSYNWWNNQIGVPLRFQKTMLLLETRLTDSRKAEGLKLLERAQLKMTGQNLLWFAEIVLNRALLIEDFPLAKKAIVRVQTEVEVSVAEGIKADNSFHQHGALITSGGYGARFSYNNARFISFTQGTSLEFSPDKYKIISEYILDGQRWFVRNNKWDYGVVGREIVRKGINASLLGDACALMASVRATRSEEFLDCARSIKKNEPSSLEGNKHFWESDIMTHHRKNYYASVRMYSERTYNNDAPSNSEGLLSHHIADGMNLIMKDGSEYEDIFPVWDWSKIPGTTTEYKSLKPAVYRPGDWNGFAHLRYKGKSVFAGGVSDGRNGIAAMDFRSDKNYENVDAKKAWFFFDEGFISLGTGITSAGTSPVITTLEQSFLKGKVKLVFASGVSTDMKRDEESHTDLKSLIHNEVAYLFLKPQRLTVSKKKQTGNWFRISEQYDKTPVTKDVFSAWLSHGSRPKSSAYEYLVLPKSTESEISAYVLEENFTVINSPSYQSVFHKKTGLFQAVFYERGRRTISGLMIEVSKPCLLMLRKMPKGIYVSVSDPTQDQSFIEITLDKKMHKIMLPQGLLAGKTVEVTL